MLMFLSLPGEYDLHDLSIFYSAVHCFALYPHHNLPLCWLFELNSQRKSPVSSPLHNYPNNK